MYVLNSDAIPKDKIYFCNGLIAEFLLYQKHLPLLCKKERMFGFAITENLEKAIKDIPWWLKISKCF